MNKLLLWSLVCGIASAIQINFGLKDTMDLAAQAYCAHMHPSDIEIFDTLDPVCQEYNLKQDALNFLAPILGSEADTQTHHPKVGDHAIIWYKNWLTCTICQTWTVTLKNLAQDPTYIKAFKGFSWMICATQFS